MKAIVCTKYGPPEVLKLREVEKPVPRDDEVRIKIFATAVTASDTIVRGFKFPRWHPMGIMMGLVVGFTAPRKPILGMVLSGEVESTSKAVKRFKAGDRVFGSTLDTGGKIRFGAYAEYICLPENSLITQQPANISNEEAAAMPYGYGLATYFLKKGDVREGQNVLIYGASGAIGTSAVQLAKARGAEVTGVCSARNFELVQSLGANHLLDYTTADAPPPGARYDFIFDAVGKSKTSTFKENCQKALAPGGQYSSVDSGNPQNSLAEMETLKELVETGRFKAVIDRSYPLAEMAAAHHYVDQGHKKGNVVINVVPDRPV
jgi:NADPH:quinone reductase-like Zn-dependent oxidoreductase